MTVFEVYSLDRRNHAAHQTGSQPYDTADELISTWYQGSSTSDGTCVQSIALAFERCILHGLAAWQKLSIFKATEHHGMKDDV